MNYISDNPKKKCKDDTNGLVVSYFCMHDDASCMQGRDNPWKNNAMSFSLAPTTHLGSNYQ